MINLSFLPTVPDAALKALVAVTLLIVTDALLGVILATMSKTLDLKKLPAFLQDVFLFIGGLLVLFVIGLWYPDMMAVFAAAAAALTLAYFNDIKNKLASLIKKAPTPPIDSVNNNS